MAVKLILLDLDGTLLNSEKQLSEGNRRALEEAAAKGIHIVPSTGRFYGAMPQMIRELPFVRYFITINGAQIFDADEQKVLHREEFPLAVADEIYDYLDTLPVIYDCYSDNRAYMDRRHYEKAHEYVKNPHILKMIHNLRQPVEDFRGMVRQLEHPMQKLQMFFRTAEERAVYLPEIQQRLSHMAVCCALETNVEVNAIRANKGQALKILAEHLGIDMAETMAIGDDTNDLSMVQTAGIGVAMGNASAPLKAVADYITESNDLDGVALAIAKFCR